MKKVITGAFILALSISAVHAQETTTEKGKEYRKEHRMGGFDQLNLSADQKSRLQAIKENYKKQSEELKSDKQLSDEQRKQRRKEMHLQYRSEAEAILTPAQKEQLSKMKAERGANNKQGDWNKDKRGVQGKWEGKKGGGKGFERSTAIQKEMNLTQEQQAKMQEIRKEYQSKMEQLRNDEALTAQQKRAKMQEIMKAQQKEMKTVLTKEQIEKMESLKKEHSTQMAR